MAANLGIPLLCMAQQACVGNMACGDSTGLNSKHRDQAKRFYGIIDDDGAILAIAARPEQN